MGGPSRRAAAHRPTRPAARMPAGLPRSRAHGASGGAGHRSPCRLVPGVNGIAHTDIRRRRASESMLPMHWHCRPRGSAASGWRSCAMRPGRGAGSFLGMPRARQPTWRPIPPAGCKIPHGPRQGRIRTRRAAAAAAAAVKSNGRKPRRRTAEACKARHQGAASGNGSGNGAAAAARGASAGPAMPQAGPARCRARRHSGGRPLPVLAAPCHEAVQGAGGQRQPADGIERSPALLCLQA